MLDEKTTQEMDHPRQVQGTYRQYSKKSKPFSRFICRIVLLPFLAFFLFIKRPIQFFRIVSLSIKHRPDFFYDRIVTSLFNPHYTIEKKP